MPAVIVQLAPPTQRNRTGVTAQGDYEETDGRITLVAYNGRPLPAERRRRFTHKLKDGDNPRVFAKRLTLEYAGTLRTSFSGPIQYPDYPTA